MTGRGDPLLEELRIRRVIEGYCAALDAGAVDEVLQLFDDECSFAMMGRTYRGRDELASAWEQVTGTDRPTTLHALVNPVITVDGPHATAVSGWVLVDRSGDDGRAAIALAGRYHDVLRRGNDGRWRFTDRRVQTLARPSSTWSATGSES
jgi:uncharacterized protein (TIGR02246 family)